MSSIYNELMIPYNNLDWQFRVHIFEPKKDTTIQGFFYALDRKLSIQREIAKYEIGSTESTLRLYYNSHSGFQADASRFNQYSSSYSQTTEADRITLNKNLEAITSLTQEQLQFSQKQYSQAQANSTPFYKQKQ